MKTKTYLYAIIFSFFVITGCSSNKSGDPAPGGSTGATGATGTTGVMNVYTTGVIPAANYLSKAVLWKNNVATILSDVPSEAYAITVKEGSTYIAGTILENGKAITCYWKNNTIVKFNDNAYGVPNAIMVQGNDVYMAGSAFTSPTPPSSDFAVYWKNGVMASLPMPLGTNTAIAYDIVINGTDIYVCGTAYSIASRRSFACYWKNGIPTLLSENSTNSYARAMAFKGNQFYIVGYTRGIFSTSTETGTRPTYWLNTVETTLVHPYINCSLLDIKISGEDIYMLGSANEDDLDKTAYVYWKNGVATTQNGKFHFGSIDVFGDDIYLGGSTHVGSINDNPKYYATYLKNGMAVQLSDKSKSLVTGLCLGY
jgi:uncharacterized membrane protein